jgi:hypothetical protein
VILIDMPIPAHFRALLDARYAGDQAKWAAEMKRRYGALELLHFSADGYGTEDFRDADHLSERGAVRFADTLAATLRARAR